MPGGGGGGGIEPENAPFSELLGTTGAPGSASAGGPTGSGGGPGGVMPGGGGGGGIEPFRPSFLVIEIRLTGRSYSQVMLQHNIPRGLC
jgi:hypothetical protein